MGGSVHKGSIKRKKKKKKSNIAIFLFLGDGGGGYNVDYAMHSREVE